MFDSRRITPICLKKRLSKHKMTVFSKNLGGHGLIAPPPATPMAPAPSHTEMHVRSIFPLLWLLLSYQSSRFCDCFLVSKWIFQQNDHCLTTKFHAGCEQALVCVVINNSSYPVVKKNNTASHAFGKYWMQARGFLHYRLKCCWQKVIYCICLELSDGRYFTGLAGILLLFSRGR